MKKNIVYIAVALILILSSFILSDKTTSLEEAQPVLPETTVETVEQTSPVVEWFSEKYRKNVGNKLDALLKRINKRHDFHGALLVAKNGKVLYNNQIGYKDFKTNEPLDENAVFQLASVSKQFTAAAIMILHERGQLKLTDTVNAYFPDFPYKNITIKQLLNHTAGLPKYFWVAEHEWQQPKAPSNSEMMALLEDTNVQRYFKPGYNFDYSNTGYFVLASIVEQVTGSSFSNFVHTHIFEPLDMTDSYVYSYENDSIPSNQLDGYRLYRRWRHQKIGYTVNDAVVGDKNVYSTTEDLFKWVLGLNNEKLFSKETLQLMYTPGETVSGRKVPYGFGFRICNDNNENRIYHHGKWNGFRTGLTQYIDDDLVVIVLEHTSYEGIAALNKKVKNIVLNNFKL
ncbi:MAG: serine hydrolase domain-containing protein [Flavobacteriaceae bacterium]